MSPLLRNELRLRLGPGGCRARLWRAGLSPRCLASGHSADDDGIQRSLDALVAQGHRLPRTAMVCVEDEFLYYALIPAAGRWRAAQQAAQELFATSSGDEHLLVEISLLPDGRSWLAVAVHAALVESARAALAERDVELRGFTAALLDDLRQLRIAAGFDSGVLALLRSEGATLVGVNGGVIADLAWERCEIGRPQMVATRVQGYRARFASQIGHAYAVSGVPVLVRAADAAQQALLQAEAASHGWRIEIPAEVEPT